jgi:hypothetical protein
MSQAGWTSTDASVTTDDTTLAGVIAGLSREAKPGAQTQLSVVLALDSNLGEQAIANWAEAGTLFTPSTPHGAVPGEGAAGLLIAHRSQANGARPEAGQVLIHPLEEGHRTVSADESKKTDAALLHELAGRALQHGRTNPAAVAAVVADTGPRPNRVLEVIACAKRAMPELDETDGIRHTGYACGVCGEVPFMSTVVLAYHEALTQNAPVLAISSEDTHRRTAALLQPTTQPA